MQQCSTTNQPECSRLYISQFTLLWTGASVQPSSHGPFVYLQANGITLTFIEKSGLIQTAENLGLLSRVSDRCAHAFSAFA